MKNLLQIALVAAAVAGIVAYLAVGSLVGNQPAELGASGTRFPNGITSGANIASTKATGTSTLDLLGTRSCIEMVAANGSTTAFYATSSTSGLVQIASCGN